MTAEAEAVDARRARSRHIRRAVRWFISIAAITFVVWMLPIRDRCTDAGCQDGLLTTFKRTNLPMLAGLFGIYLLGTVAWAARWRALLVPADVRLSLGAAWRVTIEAQAGGILLPGGVGGDALRVAYAKERSPDASLAKITASIMADRVVGLASLAGLALLLALVFGASGRVAVALPMLGGIPLVAVVGWFVLRHPALLEMAVLRTKYGERFARPMLEYAASKEGPRAIVHGVLLSLLVSGTQLLAVRGLILTVGATPTVEAAVYVGTTLSMIVAALPMMPGGWGTADAAYVFFLGQAGVAPAAAAAVCLLYRLMWYASGSMGAVSAFARAHRE